MKKAIKKQYGKTLSLAGALFAITLFAAAEVGAATISTSMSVSAGLTDPPPGCTIAATGPAFTGQTGLELLANGTVIANCTTGLLYNIAMDAGLNFSGSVRRVTNGANLINYTLFKDALMTAQWGDSGVVPGGTYPSGSPQPGTGNGGDQTTTVFGKLTATAAPAGTYVDTVVVTVHF
jgi:spore coat protein U-like protein